MLDDLSRHRVIVTLGKGGVGRTAVCAALAIAAARRGKRTLLMETDARTPIAAGYGRKPGIVPVALAPNLWGLFLGGRESLEDYLGMTVPRPILRAVLASSLYQYFVDAAPALRELTMMGKVYHEVARRPRSEPQWDLVIVDAPASGQALAMLKMPFAARETFAGSLVGREANEVAAFFLDRQLCAIVAVTTGEPLAVSEVLETERALEALDLQLATIIFNRMRRADFEARDVARFMRRAARDRRLAHLDDLAELLRAELRRVTRERRAVQVVLNNLKAPVIRLDECSALDRGDLAAALATQLENRTKSAARFEQAEAPGG